MSNELTPEQEALEDEITNMMHFSGEKIMAEFGKYPDKLGVFSKEDLAFLEAECRRRVTMSKPAPAG